MYKFSKIIVKMRYLFFLLFTVGCIYSFLAMKQVNVNYDLTKYLPKTSETKIALDVMKKEFGLNGVANVVISDISVEEAIEIKNDISQFAGVLNASFYNNEQYYKDGNALIKITLREGDFSEETETTIHEIKSYLDQYDIEMTGSSAYQVEQKEDVIREMTIILVVSVPIIILILFLAANSYAEVFVFGVVVGVSVILNKGSNLLLGEISYVTDSIAIVLQLALAMDYSIILLHRFEEEKKNHPTREAITHALKNSITSISASSLTTIFGLISIMFMQFSIGYDIGIVLAKSIICSLLSVFLLMPGILLIFNSLIEKTKHKKLIPDMKFISKYIIKTRFLMPFICIIIIFFAYLGQSQNTFIFGLNKEDHTRYTEQFGKTNTLSIIVPKGQSDNEKRLVTYIMENPKINNGNGIELLGLRENLNASEFASKIDIEPSNAYGIYGYYANDLGESYEQINFNSLISFMINNKELLELSNEQIDNINKINTLTTLKNQMIDYQTFAYNIGLDSFDSKMIYTMYEMSLDTEMYELRNILSFMVNHATELQIPNDQLTSINETILLIDSQNSHLSHLEFANLMGIQPDEVYNIYTLYEMSLDEQKYGVTDLLQYIVDNQSTLNISDTQILSVQEALQLTLYKETKLNVSEFAQIMEMSEEKSEILYNMYNQENQTIQSEILFNDMILYMFQNQDILMLNDQEKLQVNKVYLLLNNISLSISEFSNVLTMTFEQTLGLYGAYSLETGYLVDNNEVKAILSFMLNHNQLLSLNENMTTSIQSILNLFELSQGKINASTFSTVMDIEFEQSIGIYAKYAIINGYEVESIRFNTMIQFILSQSSYLNLSDEQLTQLYTIKNILDASGLNIDSQSFSSLLQLEQNDGEMLYGIYTVNEEDLNYSFVELINYMIEKHETLGVSNEQKETLFKSKEMIDRAINQFESENYARMVFNINLDMDDEEAYALIRDLRTNLSDYYDEYYVLGDTPNILDIKDSFDQDVLIVSLISIISIFFILTLSFKSIIIPIILVLVIQGSIWINFSFSALLNQPIIFMGYIMVMAIQMGATIDYAIVMTARYKGFRERYPKFEAVKKAIMVSLPTLITSGGILIVAGFSVGLVSSVQSISDLGILMGRGAMVSIILVLFLLPQLLILFDRFIKVKSKV